MVTNAGQFEVYTEENGHIIKCQEIDDPFIYTTLKPRGWRAAWQVLRGRFTLAVRVRGKHDAVYRAVMTADYTPDPPREIRDRNSDALMATENFPACDRLN